MKDHETSIYTREAIQKGVAEYCGGHQSIEDAIAVKDGIEITSEMLDVGRDALFGFDCQEDYKRERAVEIFLGMLALLPQAPRRACLSPQALSELCRESGGNPEGYQAWIDGLIDPPEKEIRPGDVVDGIPGRFKFLGGDPKSPLNWVRADGGNNTQKDSQSPEDRPGLAFSNFRHQTAGNRNGAQ